jgi:hypothetical protein
MISVDLEPPTESILPDFDKVDVESVSFNTPTHTQDSERYYNCRLLFNARSSKKQDDSNKEDEDESDDVLNSDKEEEDDSNDSDDIDDSDEEEEEGSDEDLDSNY